MDSAEQSTEVNRFAERAIIQWVRWWHAKRRVDDDWDVARLARISKLLAELEPRHSGHRKVRDNEVRHLLANALQRRQTAQSGQDFKALTA